MIIRKRNKKTTMVGKENSSAYLEFDNVTYDIIDFNETWERSEVKAARELIRKKE